MKKESISFLKNRNRKLLSIRLFQTPATAGHASPLTDKSFLVLFFKKEHFSLPLACVSTP
jgi:hypothetical protein